MGPRYEINHWENDIYEWEYIGNILAIKWTSSQSVMGIDWGYTGKTMGISYHVGWLNKTAMVGINWLAIPMVWQSISWYALGMLDTNDSWFTWPTTIADCDQK